MIPAPAAPCVKEVRPHGHCTLVVLCGEIDIHTAPAVSTRLDLINPVGDTDLLIDLRPVDFMDSSGASLLERARSRTVGRSGRLRLICTRPALLRLLKHPSLQLRFDIIDQLPAPAPPRAAV